MLSLNVTALGLVAFMCTFHRSTEALRDDVLSSSILEICSAVSVTPPSPSSPEANQRTRRCLPVVIRLKLDRVKLYTIDLIFAIVPIELR